MPLGTSWKRAATAIRCWFEPGETWGWCYEHERYLGPFESVR